MSESERPEGTEPSPEAPEAEAAAGSAQPGQGAPPGPAERPGRYSRSTGGLVASMVVVVVAVVGAVAFMGLFRDETSVEPDAVDYLATVRALQDAELEPVYPAEVPKGWKATKAEVLQEGAPGLDLGFLTDDDEFVGVVWTDEDVDDLLRERVDDSDVESTERFTVSGSVAEQWQGYEDPGGDLAYAAEVERRTVLVYGSASEDDFAAVVGALTTARTAR